jgi:hypothetical protein
MRIKADREPQISANATFDQREHITDTARAPVEQQNTSANIIGASPNDGTT